jgi:CubicO group peptidase (beta-lactamase class C family)
VEAVSAQLLESWVREARERWSIPGMAVGVSRAGERRVAADGVRRLGGGEPVRPATLFRIASITKPFVASLVMSVTEDGRLSLDEPPPGSAVDATVRDLLSHRGGLAHEWPTSLDEFGDGDEALLRLGAAEPERLPVPPGELFSYCNAGYWLAAAAATRAAGGSFEQALTTRILEPLGLTATTFDAVEPAQGHVQVEPGADEHRPVEDRYPRVRRPSGGLWSCVDELLAFAEHHLGGQGPLTPESVMEMQRPHAAGPGFDYGLGWFLTETRGRRAVGHPGSAAGYQSQLLLFPDEGVAVAGLANSSRGRVAIEEVLERLGLGVLDEPDVPLSPEELEVFAGHYSGQGVELEFAAESGMLRVDMREHDPFSGEWLQLPSVRARPIGEREFEIVDGEWRGERFDFPRDGFVCMSTLAQRV